MLRELRIKNFAIADEVRVTFEPGLNVITGETGAGKSVIIRALALLCGSRSSADMIRADEDSATIEGLFSLPDDTPGISDAGVEDADEVLIRRVVQRNGKAKAQVNGNPVTLGVLSQLATHTVQVYGQHEQTALLDPASHLELVDRYAAQDALRTEMASRYAALSDARRRLDDATRGREMREQRRELLEFQVRELANAAPRSGEEADLRREREILRHAGKLHEFCARAEATLYSGEEAVVDVVGRLATALRELVRIDPALEEPLRGLDSAGAELEAAARSLGASAERIRFDPQRLEEIEERLALLARLARKHGCDSDALPATLEKLNGELAAIEGGEQCAEQLRAEVAEAERSAMKTAHSLSVVRKKAATRLEKEMERELAELGMAGAVFRIRIESTDEAAALTEAGADTITFFLSANPGNPPKPLVDVASGGELSRILLALKALTANVTETPILVFDEVDAGIGGNVADAVGRRLKRLAGARQLLCITHLPQIAAYADHHLGVEKTTTRGRTITRTRPLEENDRIAELSRMLGGSVAPAEAGRYAKKLLAEARESAPLS